MVAREKKDRLYASVVARYGVDIFLLSLLMAAAERERGKEGSPSKNGATAVTDGMEGRGTLCFRQLHWESICYFYLFLVLIFISHS